MARVPGLDDLPFETVPGEDAYRLIVTPAAGGPSNEHKAGLLEAFHIETVSVVVDATGSGGGTTIALTQFDRSGKEVASAVTGAQVVGAIVAQVTFAPNLTDTAQLGMPASTENLQAAMPDMVLSDADYVVVSATDGVTLIGELRLWVQDVKQERGRSSPLPKVPVYGT